MSSPLGVDQELLLSYTQNDTKNLNATIGIGGSEGYEFTVISIATSVLLGVMTLTTIIGRNIIIQFRYSEKASKIWFIFHSFRFDAIKEGYKILQNFPLTFDSMYCSQK